jgi:hypothetical protein
MAWCHGPAGYRVPARRRITARPRTALQQDITAQRSLTVSCGRLLGPATPPSTASRTFFPRQRFRRAPLILAAP